MLLKELMNKRLDHGKARDVGICPIRETLFQQCFDELIRQITINCAERGFLLVRVRDEFRQQLNAFQGLYDSSIAYGMRHALVAETYKSGLIEKIDKLNVDCEALENKISDMEAKMKEIVKVDSEEREELLKTHDQFKKEMKLVIYNLKDEIDTCLGNPNILN